MPMLIVYSNNPSLGKVNYQSIAHKAGNSVDRVSPAPRKKRSTTPACNIHPLYVKGSDILADIVGVDQLVIAPTLYNAGLCGGGCSDTYPYHGSTHARFIHTLLGITSFRNRYRHYSFTQHCSPVEFGSVTVLSLSRRGVRSINVIKDMRITRCTCVDIIDFKR